jgi:putative intracellular protease/amidase
MRILFVATSHDEMGNTGKKTGVWLEEIAVPYYIFKNAGFEMAIASPKGGEVPLDPRSQSIIAATNSSRRFLKDADAMNFLYGSSLISTVSANDFDMVFLPGGHGPLWDLADHAPLKVLIEAFHHQNKTIAAICHGVAGLLSAQDAHGEYLIKGRKLTGFSNNEEKLSGLTEVVPYLLESRLVALGASYSKGEDYSSYVVCDGNFITGQNPASSGEIAKKLVILLQQNNKMAISYN